MVYNKSLFRLYVQITKLSLSTQDLQPRSPARSHARRGESEKDGYIRCLQDTKNTLNRQFVARDNVH